jgi:hypothetical protein
MEKLIITAAITGGSSPVYSIKEGSVFLHN